LTTLSIDFETRATVDLRATGVYPYAQHPETDIWCFAWAFDDEEPEIWHPGMVRDGPGPSWENQGVTFRFLRHIYEGGEMRAWNAEFERIIWKYILTPRYGFPEPTREQWVCSAAEAAAMSLPRSLDQCAQVTGVGQQKDQDGYGLMMRMTRPRKIHPDGRIEWWDVEERKQRLYEYCRQDVRTERAITKVLRRLTPREREIYLHTTLKNDRGIPLDRELVLAAREVADEGIERANAALYQVTGGAVTEVTKVGQMKAWLNSQLPEKQVIHTIDGTPNTAVCNITLAPAVDSVSKAAVRELLESDLSPEVRQVLELRADAGKSSIAKLDSMLEVACEDGQLRGLTMYHGASTGREAHRLTQPGNFPQGDVPNAEQYIDAVLRRAYDEIDLYYHPIRVIVSLLRAMISARPGYDFIAADFSAIEARVLVVLAGQDDIVELWRSGQDVYKYNAARLYGVPVEQVTKQQRQTGKFQELGAGYGMGAKKAVSAGKAIYQLELSEETAKEIIDGYRKTHQRVVDFWYESDRAAIEAVSQPGSVVTFGALRNLKFTHQGAYLYLILPSKRPLVYAAPRIVHVPPPWGGDPRPAVEISAVNGYSRKWERQRMYGGLWVENIVQAVSRDLLKEADLRVEEHGYEVVLDVHDEVVAEVPEGVGSVEEFEKLLAITPPWAEGWPIKAEGWRGKRYRK
jgi:DNA polymerase